MSERRDPPDGGEAISTRRGRLPATVVALGFVSFFTDLSSEMIAPLLPAFLATLGAGATFLGVLEGFAQTTAALLKLVSGAMSDRLERRKPLVLIGYGLASAARPLMALATVPAHVFGIRVVDRVGKGLRGSPRDALVADVTPVASRGRAYGFQRAMDHCGALLGPLVAWLLLETTDLGLRGVFGLAAIPGLIALLVIVFLVRERSRRDGDCPVVRSTRTMFALPSGGTLRRYLLVVGVFALGNSSDLFLVARAIELGVTLTDVLLLWAVFHLVKSSLATPLGAWSDRIGRRPVLVIGLLVYALVYAGFGVATATWHIWLLFAIYGLHEAFTEGTEKALIADLAGPDERGRAFGALHLVTGLTALPASLLFGALWDGFGSPVAFACGAGLSLLAAVLLVAWVRPR